MVYETFGTAFVLSTRHRQTLLATRKARTMFFKTKRNPRKTTRQTLSTEQLEPKAMFSVSPVEPVVALDVGPVNQAGYDFQLKDVALVKTYCTGYCFADTDGFMKLGDIKGEVKPTERLGGNAGPETATSLRSENRFVFEIPKNDSGISLHASANPHACPEGFMKLGDIKGELQITQRVGGSADPGGDDIFMPKPNRGVSLHDSVHCLVGGIGKAPFTTGAGGVSVVHPEFSGGVNSMSQANQQPQIASVWTNGNATSIAPRHAAFARMGR